MPTPKELAFSKEWLVKCKGYDPKFIKETTSLSLNKILPQNLINDLPPVEGNAKGILNYDGLSILYNAKRKVPFVAAYNLDGKDKAKQDKRPVFQTDPRIVKSIQLDKAFYKLRVNKMVFEIGHMASNNEMGRGKNGIVKAFQSFHFTNSVPQAEKLNTGLWKGLESYVIREAATVKNNQRIAVFTGPVLTGRDPKYVKDQDFKIPLLFFKVIIFLSPKGLYSTAFMMSHEKKLIEEKMFLTPPVRKIRGQLREVGYFEDYPYRKVFQVNISRVEEETGLHFSWRGVKPLVVPEDKKPMEKIKGVSNAAEAKLAAKTRGITLSDLETTDEEISEAELKKNRYVLNMILP